MAASTTHTVLLHQTRNPASPPHDRGLLVIGIFKLSKAIFFACVALGALHFIHHDLAQTLTRLLYDRFDPENRFVVLLLGKAELVTHHKIRLFSLGSAIYGLLCSVEGVGLILRKVWAEYVTLWLSASFLPWEIYELGHHHNLWRFGILLMNALITLYLVWLLRRKRRRSEDSVPVSVPQQA